MLKVVKVRLYPTPQQQQLLEQSFGNCRRLKELWSCCPDVSRSTRGRKKSTTALSVRQEAYTEPDRVGVGSSLLDIVVSCKNQNI